MPFNNVKNPYPFQIIRKGLDPKFYCDTLNRPWMRLRIFLREGPLSRTPEHYKKFFYEWKVEQPTPVHYIPETGKWKRREDGRIVLVQNFPLDIKYPRDLHEGIWGGEGVIRGYKRGHKRWNEPVPRYWIPRLKETVVYSEILDKYIKVVVTPRALDLIDQHYGLDSYILETKPADLMSEFCLKLRREFLFNLLYKTLYPSDSAKREEIFEKYKHFLIPEEEIDWFGLNLSEAYRKQYKLDQENAKTGPYKNIFRKEYLEHLKNLADAHNTVLAEQQKQDDGFIGRLKSLSFLKKSK